MNSNSSVYMGDDGHYHDKPADWTEPAPQPTEDGDGVQIPNQDGELNPELTGDGTGETLPDADEPNPKTATAKTRKQ